jgi:hypothetical protein
LIFNHAFDGPDLYGPSTRTMGYNARNDEIRDNVRRKNLLGQNYGCV